MAMRTTCDVVGDLEDLHAKFGDKPALVAGMPPEVRAAYWRFRLDFLTEELREILEATDRGDADAAVDGLVDLVVVAIGTAHAFGVDFREAWRVVHLANMAKSPGENPTRPNPFGLPDLVKPPGWSAPRHDENVGVLSELFGRDRHERLVGECGDPH